MDDPVALMADFTSSGNYTTIRDELGTDYGLYGNDSYVDTLKDSSRDLYAIGAQRDSLYVVVPVTIIYASIFITGTIGNISTCIVIARNKSMHTATNYYLFSLAISDLLLLLSGLPAEIYLVWCKYSYIFGEGFCILRGLAAETSTNASVLTITAFTIERYVAICHPFLSQTMSKLSRAIKLILLVWLVALSFALPQALQFGIVHYKANPNMMMCTMKRVIIRHTFELSSFLFFVVPMCLITVLYALIGLKLRKSNMMKRSHGRREQTSRSCRHNHTGRSSRRVLKMLVAVVIAFFICWAPFHVQRLVAIYGTSSEDHVTSKSKWMEFLYLLLTYISGVLYYVSTTINPILYNIMSNKFRAAFMETLAKSCKIPGLASRHEQRSYSSLSRSQQRTAGPYGSRTVGTAGTGIPHDSSDCSGNSIREESPKQMTSSTEHCDKRPSLERSRSNSRGQANGTTQHPRNQYTPSLKRNSKGSDRWQEDRTDKRFKVSPWQKQRICTVVKVTDPENSRKKWWMLLKWLPSLKSLKFTRRGAQYSAPDVLEDPEEHREEYSMTVCNIREGSEQRPV